MIAENIKMYNTNNKYGLLTSVKGLIKRHLRGKLISENLQLRGAYRKHTHHPCPS